MLSKSPIHIDHYLSVMFPIIFLGVKNANQNCLELGYSNKGFQGTFVDSFGE